MENRKKTSIFNGEQNIQKLSSLATWRRSGFVTPLCTCGQASSLRPWHSATDCTVTVWPTVGHRKVIHLVCSVDTTSWYWDFSAERHSGSSKPIKWPYPLVLRYGWKVTMRYWVVLEFQINNKWKRRINVLSIFMKWLILFSNQGGLSQI